MVPGKNSESVKLTMASVTVGAGPGQARETLLTRSSVWSEMSRQWLCPPLITLKLRDDVWSPAALQDIPSLSPFRSISSISASAPSISTAYVVELEFIAMSLIRMLPSWVSPLLSMSNAGPNAGSLISIAESCRSMLSLTTSPNWSSVD